MQNNKLDGQIDFADFLNILYAHMQVEDANKEILNAFVSKKLKANQFAFYSWLFI